MRVLKVPPGTFAYHRTTCRWDRIESPASVCIVRRSDDHCCTGRFDSVGTSPELNILSHKLFPASYLIAKKKKKVPHSKKEKKKYLIAKRKKKVPHSKPGTQNLSQGWNCGGRWVRLVHPSRIIGRRCPIAALSPGAVGNSSQ